MNKECNKTACDLFNQCLYFSSNRLARLMNEVAEGEFKKTGLSPTYAFLLMLVKEEKVVTPGVLAQKLHLATSTITRFIDKLHGMGLVNRDAEGKNSFITLTVKGDKIQETIKECWGNLYLKLIDSLGEEATHKIAGDISGVCDMFEKS